MANRVRRQVGSGRALLRLLSAVVLLVAVSASALAGGRAEAAKPGENGMIAYAHGIGGFDAYLELFTVNPDASGNGKLLASTERVRQVQPEWSPDGNELAYIRTAGTNRGELWVYDLRTSAARRLVPDLVGIRNPTWSLDGQQIGFVKYNASNAADGAVWVVGRDGSNPRQIRANCGAIGRDLEWGPTGRLAFETALACPGDPPRGWSGWALVTMDAGGADVRKVRDTRMFRVGRDAERTVEIHAPESIDWSPDGSRLLIAGQWGSWAQSACGPGRGSFNPVDVWVVDAATGGIVRNLTNTWEGVGPQERSAAWSPDGSMVALEVDVYSCKDGRQESSRPRIYTMSSSGGPMKQITSPAAERGEGLEGDYTLPASDMQPAWQPCVAGKTVRCTSGGAKGTLAGPWLGPARPKEQCQGQVHVVFAVYVSMDAPGTNGCWSWNKVAPNGGGGPDGSTSGGPWWFCGNQQLIRGADGKLVADERGRIYHKEPNDSAKPLAPGYWVWDDIGSVPTDEQRRELRECAARAATGAPKETTGWIFTFYRKSMGAARFLSGKSQDAITAETGVDLFFFQTYDWPDWGCRQAPNPNCGQHPISTEPLYLAWRNERLPSGRHRFVGQVDVTGLPGTRAQVRSAVLRLCRDSLRDGVFSVNWGTGGGRLTREQLEPIREALALCVPAK